MLVHRFMVPLVKSYISSTNILRRKAVTIYSISGRHKSSNANILNPEKKLLIYHGPLTSRVKAVKIFSLTTSFGGIAAQPILLEQGTKIGGAGLAVFLCAFAGFFTFVTPLLLHFITKKYITDIYYNPQKDEYTAVTISFLLRKIETKFHSDEVKVPEIPGIFTSFSIRGKPLFVDPRQFEDTDHYARIMGYDKPIDFKLAAVEVPTKQPMEKNK